MAKASLLQYQGHYTACSTDILLRGMHIQHFMLSLNFTAPGFSGFWGLILQSAQWQLPLTSAQHLADRSFSVLGIHITIHLDEIRPCRGPGKGLGTTQILIKYLLQWDLSPPDRTWVVPTPCTDPFHRGEHFVVQKRSGVMKGDGYFQKINLFSGHFHQFFHVVLVVCLLNIPSPIPQHFPLILACI